MVQSMTGYGKAVAELPEKQVVVEIKTLNSKQLDINARINHNYRDKEIEIRNLIAERIRRGKVEISIFYDYKDVGQVKIINSRVASAYITQLKEIARENAVSDAAILDITMRMPDVFQTEMLESIDDSEWILVKKTVDEACNNIIEYRKQEGKAMELDIRNNIQAIQKGLQAICEIEGLRIDRIKERLHSYLQEISESDKIDSSRLEQEMIYYIEKLDVNEEKVRLEQHCNYFLETLLQEATGKKLGFIAQEIGREINTIGSKANDAAMQKHVVCMKDNLERIKEQVLNVL